MTSYKNSMTEDLTSNATKNITIRNYDEIDNLLEMEKVSNKTENWNKLEKSQKIYLLNVFADKYGHENGFSQKEIKSLKTFFNDSLNQSKLQKSKDVVYDKDKREIVSIPTLCLNSSTKHFTLRVVDAKRGTLKTLVTKRHLHPSINDEALNSVNEVEQTIIA